MKKQLPVIAILISFFSLSSLTTLAQVGINNQNPDPSAVLDLTSTSKGLLIPRLTAVERSAISAPAMGLMVYQTDGAEQGFWYFMNPGGWTYLYPTADNLGNHTASQNLGLNGNWFSNDGDSEGLRIDNSGNAGVGTATPSTLLHIMQTAATSAAETVARFSVNDATGSYLQIGNNSNTNGIYIPKIQSYQEGSQSPSLVIEADNNNDAGSEPVIVLNGKAAGDDVGFRSLLDIRDNNVSTLFIDKDGNVGLGNNTSPTARLHVLSSSSNFDQTFKLSNYTASGAGLYLDAQNKDWMIYGSNSNSGSGDQKLVFRDYSTAIDRMVIDNNGHVGIGTNYPGITSGASRYLTVSAGDTYTASQNAASLELHGSSNSTATPFAQIDFSSQGFSSADVAARIEARRGGSTSMGTLVLSTNNGSGLSERMRINDSGNVGIGTGSNISANALLAIKEGHIQVQQTTIPGITLGNAGTGSSCSLSSVNPKSTDVTGRITVVTGSSPGTGSYATITFNKTYGSAPLVLITPANANAAIAQSSSGVYVLNSTTTGFSLGFANSGSSSTSYQFNYLVIETQ